MKNKKFKAISLEECDVLATHEWDSEKHMPSIEVKFYSDEIHEARLVFTYDCEIQRDEQFQKLNEEKVEEMFNSIKKYITS